MSFTEKFLYHIWDAQHLQKHLKTVTGETVEILYPGRWNTASGPDFRAGIIKINNEVQRGDIEIHLKSYDWIAHNHHEDPGFNNVVLHVVYEHKGRYDKTITQSGNSIIILEMKNQLSEDIEKLLKIYPENCFSRREKFCDAFGQLNEAAFINILTKMGRQRLQSKIKRFSAELNLSDFNQLLYQGVMEAAGYSKNKFQMLNLALELDYSTLKSFYYKGMTKEEMIAIMLCSSGLTEHHPKQISTIWIDNLNYIYNSQNFYNGSLNINWKLFRLRPVNHPFIRILQLSDFIYDSLESTFFYNLLKLFSFPEDKFRLSFFRKKLSSMFSSIHPELSAHYNMGKERILAILINVLLPLVILYAQKMNYPKLDDTAWKIYGKLNGQSMNFVFEEMSQYMDSVQRKLLKQRAIYQQGLLKIYFDYCQHHLCKSCQENFDNLLDLK